MTSSCLTQSSDKKSLKAIALKLGAHVVSDWSKSCDALIMSQLNVTVKVRRSHIAFKPSSVPKRASTLGRLCTRRPEANRDDSVFGRLRSGCESQL